MSSRISPSPEDRARHILIDTYWTPKGWREGSWPTGWAYQHTDPADLAFAIEHGTMYSPPDPATLSYAAVGADMHAALDNRQPWEIGNLFLATLSTRKLAARSALGSYAYARHFPRHDRACRDPKHRYNPMHTDLNMYSFHRHMWGGNGWHIINDPVYVAFDLREALRMPVPTPGPEDLAILTGVVDVARNLPPSAHVTDLERALAKLLRSNQNERRVLVEILGIAEILVAPDHPGFTFQWVQPGERPRAPGGRANDWAYPIGWWRGGGVSEQALGLYFPALV